MASQAKPGKTGSKIFLEIRYLADLDRIDGEPMEFEWKIFQGFTTLGILEEIPKIMTELQCELEQFKERIIFMSMYIDIAWGESRKQREWYCEFCQNWRICLKIPARTLVISGAWMREEMVWNPYSQTGRRGATSALERRESRSKGKEKKSIHFNGSEETVELILRTLLSVNQLSAYGEVADLCEELAKDSPSARKHAENENWEPMVVPTEFPNANTISQTDNVRTWKRVARIRAQIRRTS